MDNRGASGTHVGRVSSGRMAELTGRESSAFHMMGHSNGWRYTAIWASLLLETKGVIRIVTFGHAPPWTLTAAIALLVELGWAARFVRPRVAPFDVRFRSKSRDTIR